MVLLECGWDSKLDVAGRVKARMHGFLIVLHALRDSLKVRVVCFERHPLGRLLLWGQACFIHSLG